MASAESSTNTMEFGTNQNLLSKKRSRYGRVILIFAVSGIIVLGCLIFLFFQQDSQTLPEAQSQKIPSIVNLQGILSGTYEATRFNGSWISDDEILTRNVQGEIVLFNVATKSKTILLSDKSILDYTYDVELSADKKYLWISVNPQKIYRHSFLAYYMLYNIEQHKKIDLTDSNNNPILVQLVKWAPIGNGFAYVHDYDVYYRPSVESNVAHRITYDGNHMTIYNGICDWVYEEEIFSDTTALWFSPDGRRLAYASFNDTNVDVMDITYYGEPGNINYQYPGRLSLKYPKPGRRNPTFSLSVVNLNEMNGKLGESRKLPLLTNFSEPILNNVAWISNDSISACVMNRIQNDANVFACELNSFKCGKMFSLKSDRGWVEFTAPKFSSDGKKVLFIKSVDQGNGLGAYRHVVIYDSDTESFIPLTRGKFTVVDILAWDQNTNEIYFHATGENDPKSQQVYKINGSGNDSQNPECLSCGNENMECSFGTAIFSKSNSYFEQTCLGPGIPVVSIFDKENKKVLTWEDNKRLQNFFENVTLPEVKFLKVPVAPGMEAQVKLLLPVNMDKSGQKKYPLLVNVYGGPNSNQVYNRFRITWETYLCLNFNVIIALIDGRGSGLKGDDMLFANYRKLGTAEIIDQLNVTYYLQNQYPYIDRQRSAIWGWSYGGYATGMALSTDNRNVFKCGASVAPVTDWTLYDSIYTERYMGLPLPQDNIVGYTASSLIKHSHNLGSKMYLLVHGTLDDNVHYQQSMMLSRELEISDIQFRQQFYPDEVHSLNGVRMHFYHTLEHFILECFNLN